MNIKLIVWIIGIILGIVFVASIWYLIFAPKPASKIIQQTTTFPHSGSITTISPSSATSSQSSEVMNLASQSGDIVATKDFLHNGVTIPDTVNTGRYLLAGNLGYCPSDPQKCQAASSTGFNIFYNSMQQSFTIALTEEPIGSSRLAMEQFMLVTLGITQQQMCNLNYYVGTISGVNAMYSDRNLGFSFCPGATVLPK